MNSRVIGFPSSPSVDDEYQSWVWDGQKWVSVGGGNSGGGGGIYDDAEVRALIAANASDISDNSGRIDALEQGGGGVGDSFWVEESAGVIKYTGTVKAADMISTG